MRSASSLWLDTVFRQVSSHLQSIKSKLGGTVDCQACAARKLHWNNSGHISKRDKCMLKITRVASSNQEITLQLAGRVTGRWVELLRESADSVLEEGMRLTLDLENICFIDCGGLALLKSLIHNGVQQVNAPLFVAEQMRECEGEQGD